LDTVAVGTTGASLSKYRWEGGETMYVPSTPAGDAAIHSVMRWRENNDAVTVQRDWISFTNGYVASFTIPPSPIASHLSVRSLDGRIQMAMAVYANGLTKIAGL
jgi:hypothetical protein